jgi:hypothetical protein
MKEKNNLYEDFEQYLIEEEKKLDVIYKELLKNNENKNAIKKFDHIVKSKIDYRGLLPCSKSYEGESLLTLSKTWMILILIKITKGKSKKEQFLQLVNSSLTHELNEYNEYKEFYIEQCELIFSDDEAFRQINLNPKMPTKLDNSITHEKLKNYYIYLLYRPKYFQKMDLDEIEKIKKVTPEEKSEKNRKSIKNESNKNKKNKNSLTKPGHSDGGSESEENEKGDRLDERDMISKNRAKEPSYSYGDKKKDKNKSDKSERNKYKKKKNEEDDSDYETISNILNKRGKSEKRKSDKKKKKKNSEKKNGSEKNM